MSAVLEHDLQELPAGWRWATLGEICSKPQYGWTTKARPAGGGIKLLRTSDITSGAIDWAEVPYCTEEPEVSRKYLVCEGDILISRAGSVGVSHLVTCVEPAVFASYLIRFRPNENVSAKYVAHFLRSPLYWRQIADNTAGIAVPNVNASKLERIVLPLAPRVRQDEIVAEIEKQFSRLDEAIANLKRIRLGLQNYRAAVLKSGLEGRLVPTEAELALRDLRSVQTGAQLMRSISDARRAHWKGKGKYKEPTPPEIKDLRKPPEAWTWASLDQIAQEGRPIIYGIIKPGPHVPNGIPYVRVTEMKDGNIDVPNLRRASFARAAKFARATLQTGDVLISKDGTIGRVAVVPPELAGGNITQHVMRAPIHQMIDRDYVVWAIRSDQCQRWLTGETKGVALRGVNVEDFRRLPIPIPPVGEQKRIVREIERRLSVAKDIETQLSANLRRAELLRQRTLDQAFALRPRSVMR